MEPRPPGSDTRPDRHTHMPKSVANQQNPRWPAPITHPMKDRGYVGTSAITPIKKAPGRERLEWEKEFNRTIAGLRAPVEHCIAHLKNWKILSKGYRGRLAELPGIIRIVTQLELLRTDW